MLFGLFFGVQGTSILPVHMGQMAGSNVIPATIGFLLTGVSLPLLGVAVLSVSAAAMVFSSSGTRSGEKVFLRLHLPSLPDDRAVLRDTEVRDHVFHGRALSRFCPSEHHTLFLFIFTLVFFAAALYSRSLLTRF